MSRTAWDGVQHVFGPDTDVVRTHPDQPSVVLRLANDAARSTRRQRVPTTMADWRGTG